MLFPAVPGVDLTQGDHSVFIQRVSVHISGQNYSMGIKVLMIITVGLWLRLVNPAHWETEAGRSQV